jgi:hypothetical protein
MLALACLAFAWSCHARAQVHKCTTPDGLPLYTDQQCAALGATERPAEPVPTPDATPDTGPKALGAAGARLYRGGCSRTLQDLVFEITTAVDAQDANRLSSVYHWVGASDGAANAVMDRLEAIVHRPLLDIVPVSASPAQDTTVLPGPADVPRTTVRRPPVGIRLEQTLPNGITPASTVLGLRRHFGCWWISL